MEFILQGDVALLERLELAQANAPKDLSAAMYKEGSYILRKSVEVVPVDFGVLRGSATITLPKTKGTMIELTFGYGGAASAYALAIHENPRAGKTGGVSPSGQPYSHWAKTGGWKYLERPCQEQFPRSAERMALDMTMIFEKRAGNLVAAEAAGAAVSAARPRAARLARRRSTPKKA